VFLVGSGAAAAAAVAASPPAPMPKPMVPPQPAFARASQQVPPAPQSLQPPLPRGLPPPAPRRGESRSPVPMMEAREAGARSPLPADFPRARGLMSRDGRDGRASAEQDAVDSLAAGPSAAPDAVFPASRGGLRDRSGSATVAAIDVDSLGALPAGDRAPRSSGAEEFPRSRGLMGSRAGDRASPPLSASPVMPTGAVAALADAQFPRARGLVSAGGARTAPVDIGALQALPAGGAASHGSSPIAESFPKARGLVGARASSPPLVESMPARPGASPAPAASSGDDSAFPRARGMVSRGRR
jgi:hypothetical protein